MDLTEAATKKAEIAKIFPSALFISSATGLNLDLLGNNIKKMYDQAVQYDAKNKVPEVRYVPTKKFNVHTLPNKRIVFKDHVLRN